MQCFRTVFKDGLIGDNATVNTLLQETMACMRLLLIPAIVLFPVIRSGCKTGHIGIDAGTVFNAVGATSQNFETEQPHC